MNESVQSLLKDPNERCKIIIEQKLPPLLASSFYKWHGEKYKQEPTPLPLILEMISGKISGEVLVINNVDIFLALQQLRDREEIPQEYISHDTKLTLLTDTEFKIPAEYGSVIKVDNLNEPATIDMMGKKFDFIIGNPPYQISAEEGHVQPKAHNLWTKFSTFGYDLLKPNGHLSFVTPSSWGSPSNEVFKMMSSDDCNFISADLDVKRFFNVGSTFSAWHIQKAKQQDDVKLGDITVDKKRLKYIPTNPSTDMINLHNKVCWSDNAKLDWKIDTTTNHSTKGKKELWSDIRTDEHPYEVYHTNAQTKYSSVKSDGHDSKKVAVTLSGNYKPRMYSEVSASEIVMFVEAATDQELKNLHTIMTSKLFNAIAASGKWSGYLSKPVLNQLPKLDTSKSWTDEEIYEHFNLTDSEIKLVERINEVGVFKA